MTPGNTHTNDYWIEGNEAVPHCGSNYWKEWGAGYFPAPTNNVAGIYQEFGSSPGSVYQASGWFYTKSSDTIGSPTFNSHVWIDVSFLDAGGGLLALYTSGDFSASVGQDAWFQYQVTNKCDLSSPVSTGDPYFTNYAVSGTVTQMVAPAGTATVRYRFAYLQANSEGGSCFFDEAALNQSACVEAPLVITVQPQSVVVNAYDTTSFSVTASGYPTSYQWFLNGTNTMGATSNALSSTLTISNVVQTNLGVYSVVVSNAFGTTNSGNATLSMYPFLATPFGGLDTYWGYTNILSVGAWGTGPLDYQWFDDGTAINGPKNETLTLTSIQATNAGLYSVVVSSALGSVTNTPEQVVVNPAGVSLGFSPTLTISGVVGYSYIIQRTANLSDTNSWITMTNLTLTQPVQIWVDSNTDASQPSNPQRFYQVLPGQ